MRSKGWINVQGYRCISIRGQHYREHRFFMEQHLGRKLGPDEDVHHLNGIRADNRLENLEVIPRDVHGRLSAKARVYKKGYRQNITPEERQIRADRCREMVRTRRPRKKKVGKS